jgi:hypothetical protein
MDGEAAIKLTRNVDGRVATSWIDPEDGRPIRVIEPDIHGESQYQRVGATEILEFTPDMFSTSALAGVPGSVVHTHAITTGPPGVRLAATSATATASSAILVTGTFPTLPPDLSSGAPGWFVYQHIAPKHGEPFVVIHAPNAGTRPVSLLAIWPNADGSLPIEAAHTTAASSAGTIDVYNISQVGPLRFGHGMVMVPYPTVVALTGVGEAPTTLLIGSQWLAEHVEEAIALYSQQ